MTFQNQGFGEMPSARLASHRNSVQNGVVESFPTLTGTIFVFFYFGIFRTTFGQFPSELRIVFFIQVPTAIPPLGLVKKTVNQTN